ncbi:MAG: endoribonuclease MazF [Elusimicrobia bacterium]|nr:endoribonuclease MazF [Elusimicrobiota bacterium]
MTFSADAPDRGDIVWLEFNPQSGHEQAGHRPALVLSPKSYNKKVGLALVCPITSQIKGYPFEVPAPAGAGGLKMAGVVLSDQVKSLDWRARRARVAGKASVETVAEVLSKLSTLLAS